MNSYEREVIAQQRVRRRWQMRAAAALIGVVAIVAAFWGSGALDRSWWQARVDSEAEVPAPAAPKPSSATAPVTENQQSSAQADEGAVGKLRLVATQPGRNVREGTAQIATGKANSLTYIAGALLANGASLSEVHADHVVLKRGAATTQLYVDGAARNARAPKGEPVSEELITVEAAKPAVSKLVGPETFGNLMRTAPRFTDDNLVGFEVFTGTDGAALSRLNLQSGDVVTDMDGKPVKNVDQLYGHLKAISAGASVTATVLRGAEMLVVSLDGAALKEQASPPMAGVMP